MKSDSKIFMEKNKKSNLKRTKFRFNLMKERTLSLEKFKGKELEIPKNKRLSKIVVLIK